MVPSVSWDSALFILRHWMKGCSDLLNNTRHTVSLLKQGSASHTSTAMGPIQADHCRSVPTLQADVLLLTTATAEQCSRGRVRTSWTTLSQGDISELLICLGMLLGNLAMGLSLSPTQYSAPAALQKIKLWANKKKVKVNSTHKEQLPPRYTQSNLVFPSNSAVNSTSKKRQNFSFWRTCKVSFFPCGNYPERSICTQILA